MADWLAALHNLFRSRYHWMTTEGGLVFAALLTIFAGTVGVFVLGDCQIPRWKQALGFACFFPLAWAAWWCVRDRYLRSGCGYRIGVLFEGGTVPGEQVQTAASGFAELASDRRVKRPIAIRVIPSNISRVDDDVHAFQKRYKFDIIMFINISLDIQRPGNPVFNTRIFNLTNIQMDQAFAKASATQLATIATRMIPTTSLDELLKQVGKTFFEVVLGAIVMMGLWEERHEEIIPLLEELERRLGFRFVERENPRVAFRIILKHCLLKPSLFPGRSPPGPDRLDYAIEQAKSAIAQIGKQFPDVYLTQSRNYFFRGDIDEAVACLDAIDSDKLSNVAKAALYLDYAVLNLLKSNWVNAAKWYNDLFSAPGAVELDWNDLIDFADTIYDMQYEAAIFAVCLYRKVSGTVVVDKEVEARMFRWLGADQSRKDLITLYYRAPRFKKSAIAAKGSSVTVQKDRKKKRRK